MRILTIVAGKFPTKKAYGVTTGATLESIKSLGSEALCISFMPDGDFQPLELKHNQLYFPSHPLLSLCQRYAYKGGNITHKIAWRMQMNISYLFSIRKIKRIAPEVIWIRDSLPFFVNYGKFKDAKIVIEFHHRVKKSTKRIISKVEQSRIVLAPISPIIAGDLTEFELLGYKILISPMGINPEIFAKAGDGIRTKGKDKSGPFRIGYVGSLRPGGYSKGYEDLIELASLHQKIGFDSRIMFVGIRKDEMSELENEIQEKSAPRERFELVEHVPHEAAIQLMNECDFLALTRAENSGYAGSPLKAVEYAAIGKPIIAAISPANCAVFTGIFQPFWYDADDVRSMHETLLKIMETVDLSAYQQESIHFANSRSWNTRTSKILNELQRRTLP